MSQIEGIIAAATKVSRQKGQDDQQYWGNLVRAAAEDLSEEDWDLLPEAAQTWINDGITSMNGSADIPPFPDMADEEEPEEEPEEEYDSGDNEEEESTEVTEAAVEETKAPARKASAKKAAAPKGPKKKASSWALKEFMLKKPGITFEDLQAKMEKAGFKLTETTMRSFYNDMQQTIKILREMELLD